MIKFSPHVSIQVKELISRTKRYLFQHPPDIRLPPTSPVLYSLVGKYQPRCTSGSLLPESPLDPIPTYPSRISWHFSIRSSNAVPSFTCFQYRSIHRRSSIACLNVRSISSGIVIRPRPASILFARARNFVPWPTSPG